ncbi:hypothetical protein [Streptomyces antibioticus]|uniref:Uncharacterized protein n=1 Tax=Streptomyces antibioticus TaxID=1890 RepID=A0AAE6YDC6_STRAT|nr:hypothetical protein [Streptomyces antibioticus]OOQ47342.1 hypothetical protein AFM16_31885 [Streptomyces antibioticus]QIT47665.1 hypothetical protein HCX60_32440 [Streptomyces antibioticus]
MSFPEGVETVEVSAGAAGYRGLDGTVYAGRLRFTPSVPRVVSAEYGVIALGPVNVVLGASGEFTQELLATDAAGFEPSGWTYRVDEEFSNAPGRAYSVLLPAAVPEVTLAELVEVEASEGTVSWQPGGGAALPSDTVTAATAFGLSASAGAAAVYSRGDHTHGTPAAPVVGSTAGTYAAGDDPRLVGAAQKTANLSDLTSASTARSNLGLGGAAVLDVGTDAGTVAAGDDSRLSDARTPTAHAASHAAAGGDPVTVEVGQVSGLGVALDGKAALSGATFTGGVTVAGADLAVLGTGKGYRFRRGGGALDLEASGSDLVISNWSGGAFDGTQRSYLRLSADAQNCQVAGKVEFVDGLYGATRHVLDGAANTVGFFGAAAVGRPVVSGSWADGSAGESLAAALAVLGLITDSTTA